MNNIITIPNIKEFTQQVINGNLVLTRITPTVDVVLKQESHPESNAKDDNLWSRYIPRKSTLQCELKQVRVALL